MYLKPDKALKLFNTENAYVRIAYRVLLILILINLQDLVVTVEYIYDVIVTNRINTFKRAL